MGDSAVNLVSELGSRLLKLSRPNKDFLVKSLRQVATALSQIEQPSIPEVANTKQEALRVLEASIRPLKESVIKHDLLKHGDKDVRLLVTISVSEMFRILAPEPPFADKYLRDVFKLFLSSFTELPDIASPYFSKRAKILETVARCKCCVIMLDIDCHDLVHEMFNIFFAVVRDHHQQSLINDISSIMIDIIKEEAATSLVEIVLQNLVKEEKGASCNLAVSLIQSCADMLEPFVCGFLTSCFIDKDSIQSDLKEFYHEIILKVFQCTPQMLLPVVPNLTQELLTDQVDVRMKALSLAGKLFALSNQGVGEMYRDLFVEFLKRFSDKSAELRVAALKCGKECYIANPSGMQASKILTAIVERLLDIDDRVRTHALIVACDLAKFNLKHVPSKLISEASERLRDKKISVRKKALQKLIEVYQDYCSKCSEGFMRVSDLFEQIPCKILLLCCDKDSKEFRSQTMELVLSENLFPCLLAVEKRMEHWVHLFSLFNSLHVKSLNLILSQKRRLQTEMRLCLALWKEEKELNSEEIEKRLKSSFIKMSTAFPEPSKAAECFHKLNEMRERSIFYALAQIVDEPAYANAQAIRDKFLKTIGDKHPLYEFLQLLSSKCSCNIFSSDHVRYVLDQLPDYSSRNKHLKASSIKLLLAIVNMFPSYLRGSEQQFLRLLDSGSNSDELMEVLSKAAPHISVKFIHFYPLLEKICLEGSRAQSKHAVAALTSLIQSNDQSVFSELCEALLDSLHYGQNIPTVLQSLGCIGQYSISAFEAIYVDIWDHVRQKIFQAEPSDDQAPYDESSGCCNSCKLKIYGLKAIVKSFLPHHGRHITRKIDDLLSILEETLKGGPASNVIISCESDRAHIRLAAAKALLQLSRKWDFHISPELFCLAILVAKESDALVKKSFLDKVHKLLKGRIIPNRYACAFSLVFSDCLEDLQDNALRYMKEFINETSKEARVRNTSDNRGSLTDSPAYIVVFLVYVLAHDPQFPSEDCEDKHVYAHFSRPLFLTIEALVNAGSDVGDVNNAKDDILYLLYLLRAIKRAEDAVDVHKTPNLHVLADIGISAVNMLNRNGKQAHAPGQILLPSSLYRISPPKSSNNETDLKFRLEQSFVEKIISVLESQISMPASTLAKHSRKGQANGKLEVLKDNDLPLVSCNFGEKSVFEKTDVEKINTKRRRDLSLTGPEPYPLPKRCATATERKAVSSKAPETVTAKEPISLCGSLIVLPSVEREAPSKRLKRKGTGAKSVLKDISNQGEAMVPSVSPFDGCSYSDTIESFSLESGAHKIIYDDGDVDLVCLDSESVDTDTAGKTEGTSASENFSVDNVTTSQSAAAQHPKTSANPDTRKLRPRRITRTGTAMTKRVQKVSAETSASEIINVGRTRRQKV